jgi:hypothetical protein
MLLPGMNGGRTASLFPAQARKIIDTSGENDKFSMKVNKEPRGSPRKKRNFGSKIEKRGIDNLCQL